MPINVDIQQYNIDALKMDIKKTMLDNTLPQEAGAPRTATEIAQRMRELQVDITSVFGRLISDFLRPLVKRIIDILQKYGYISEEFDINQIDGFGFKIKIRTPLAKQQKQDEMQGILYALSLVMQYDPTGQMMAMSTDLNKLTHYVLDQMGVPNDLIKSPDEMAQAQQAAVQAQQAAQDEALEDEVQADIAKEEGKINAQKYS
jgi:hypothetical protein